MILLETLAAQPEIKVVLQSFSLFWKGLDSKTLSSFVLIMLMFSLRWIVVTWLYRTDMAPHTILQWKQRIRYILMIFILVALLVIWAPQLRNFAISIVVVAAALVSALKEIISCITGAIVRANVEGARIGGRIVINDVRGDVVLNDILSTTILEVNKNGQRTGRTVVVPNSFFLTHNATTESAEDRKYVLVLISIPLNKDEDWRAVEEKMLASARTLSEPYIKEAKKHFARFNRKFGFEAPQPEPRIMIDWSEPGRINLNLRMAAPVTEQNSMRQQIMRAVLS